MDSVAVLSLHTSPLAQPGSGDGGGMNVYVRELGAALAQAGVPVRVYVRRWSPDLPDVVAVEPGFEVVHVDAGSTDLAKEELPGVVDQFASGVRFDIDRRVGLGERVVALHANYWLSAVAAHRLKHELDLPMVATFHTLARVKAEGGDPEPELRDRAEAEVIGCCDSVCVSTPVEAEQVIRHYGVARERLEIVPPGVDHAFFSPGDAGAARRALGFGPEPMILFVGRIQPLKGLSVAVDALARMRTSEARLVVVGGASGHEGPAELARVRSVIERDGLGDRVVFHPAQPHHLLSTYYRAADVCIVPSRSESFGLVALEAAACGRPVVASSVGGLRVLVQDGVTGSLIEGRDPQVFADRIDALLDDPLERARQGAAAARLAREYTWSTSAARLRRLYSDMGARVLIDCG